MTNWSDDETITRMIGEMIDKHLKEKTDIIPQHLAGNKFKVPPVMKEWWDKESFHYQQQYVHTVGYGSTALAVYWVFSNNSITMEFRDTYGTRMFILELLKDALQEEGEVLLPWRQTIHPKADRRNPLRKSGATQAKAIGMSLTKAQSMTMKVWHLKPSHWWLSVSLGRQSRKNLSSYGGVTTHLILNRNMLSVSVSMDRVNRSGCVKQYKSECLLEKLQ